VLAERGNFYTQGEGKCGNFLIRQIRPQSILLMRQIDIVIENIGEFFSTQISMKLTSSITTNDDNQHCE
jgi:hypothetical protein